MWLAEIAGGIRLTLAVQPGARRTEIVGEYDGCLKLRVQSPPVEGAANAAIISWIAKLLGVKQRDVTLTRGLRSRRKTLEIQGVTCETASSVLIVIK